MKKASWIVLALAAVLTLLGSLASLSNAYFDGQDALGGVALEKLADGNPEVMRAVRARRATAAAYGAGFAVLLLAITLGPYRRGDPWAWYAILAGTLTETLLTFARVPLIGTKAGASTALIQLVVIGIGLALGAGRLRTLPVAALLLVTGRARPGRDPSADAQGRASDVRGAPADLDRAPGRRAREREPVGRVVREAGRQVAGRGGADRHRGGGAGRHAGRRDPQGPPQSTDGGLHAGRPLRRAGAGRGHGVPERDVPARALRVAPRPRAHDRHRRPARQRDQVGDDPAASDARAGWRWRRRATRPSAGCGRARSAGTWTPPTCARAPPSPCPSSIPARSSTSATATPPRATGKCAARAWRRRWRSRSASAWSRRRRSPGRGSRTPSTSWWRAARARSPMRCGSRSWS